MIILPEISQKIDNLNRFIDNERLLIAIDGISKVRNYDNHILYVAVASAIVTTLVTAFIYYRQSAILKQQNNIALFEKRYELYSFIQRVARNTKLIYIEELIEELSSGHDIINKTMSVTNWIFEGIIDINLDTLNELDECSKEKLSRKIEIDFSKALNKIITVKYIFALSTEELKQIEDIQKLLINIFIATSEPKYISQYKNKLWLLKELYPITENLEKQLYILPKTKTMKALWHTIKLNLSTKKKKFNK